MRQVMCACSAVAILGLPLSAAAQIKAFSVPISADRVVLEVQAPDGAPATLRVRNGETARVGRVGSAPIGLTPVLREGGMDLIVVQILLFPESGNEGIRQLARYRLTRGIPMHVVDGDPPVDVTWVRTEPPATIPPELSGPCTTCCVVCDNYLYCGCVVVTECGYCCCPAVCQCPFEPQGPDERMEGALAGAACQPATPLAGQVSSDLAVSRQRTARSPSA